jgi:hypothetical protein
LIKTYAMEIYQFYHDGQKNDGENILWLKEETFSGIKFKKQSLVSKCKKF